MLNKTPRSIRQFPAQRRVQRVPQTKSQGHVHTSTATVVIMSEVDEVEVVIDPKDIDLSTARFGGAGG